VIEDISTEAMFSLVKTAFGQRRKMLRRSLSSVVSSEHFEEAGIAPDRRPETVALNEWYNLTKAVSS